MANASFCILHLKKRKKKKKSKMNSEHTLGLTLETVF